MGDVDLQGRSIPDETDSEFVADCCRYQEQILTEANMKLKWRFADNVWEKLADNEALLLAVEKEKIRRIRTGQQKRERAQMLVVAAPDVLGSIMMSPDANPRHRIDSAKALDDFAANGPAAAPASEMFSIVINLGDQILEFNKSRNVNPHDGDPNYTNIDGDLNSTNSDGDPNDYGAWGVMAAITKKKNEGGSGDNTL